MKNLNLNLGLGLLALLPIAAGAAPVMPYGTYLVKGAFRGDYNTVLRDYGTATVRAQRADGTVIAESSVVSANEEGANFLLSIPVASAATPKSCTVGESLDCVLTTPQGAIDVPNSLTVDTPVKMGSVTFNCTEVKSYTNPKDGTVVEIPTAYIAEAQAFIDDYMGGGTYDPWADYDHDGSVRRNGLPSREGFPPERRQARAQVRARGRPRLRRFLGEHARAARMGGEARAQDRRRRGARSGSGRWRRR